MKNLTAIVHLYRGEKEKYTKVISDYCKYFHDVSDVFNGREMTFALANCNEVEDFTSVKNAIEKEIANIQSEQKLSFHSMRHFFNTYLTENDISDRKIKTIRNHSMKITKRQLTHVMLSYVHFMV